MDYGKLTKTEEYDNKTILKTTTFVKKQVMSEKLRYEERFRVGSSQEAQRLVADLVKQIEESNYMIDPEIKYKGTPSNNKNEKLDIVFCYTKIVL